MSIEKERRLEIMNLELINENAKLIGDIAEIAVLLYEKTGTELHKTDSGWELKHDGVAV